MDGRFRVSFRLDATDAVVHGLFSNDSEISIGAALKSLDSTIEVLNFSCDGATVGSDEVASHFSGKQITVHQKGIVLVSFDSYLNLH